MNADPYRGEWGGKQCRDSPVQTTRNCGCLPNQCAASGKYVDQLEEVLRYSGPKGRIGGFFAESIQVEEYFETLRVSIRRNLNLITILIV